MKITILLLSITFLISCSESAEKQTESINSPEVVPEKDSIQPISEPVIEEEINKPQTVDERIADIKIWYAEIRKQQNNISNSCEKGSRKYQVTEITPDMVFEFENHAQYCKLDNGLSFRKVDQNGYEWGSKTTLYYKNEQLFFVFVSGGSEGWAYDQRIYYNKDGEAIRILEDENEHDGNPPTKRADVTLKSRGKEILENIQGAEEEFRQIKLN